MKAWSVHNVKDDDLGAEIVFAENRKEAKEKADIGSRSDSVSDLRATRAYFADDTEHYNSNQHMCLLLSNGWVFWDYPLYDGEKCLGSVQLNKNDVAGISELGIEKYVKKKIRLKKMRRTDFDKKILYHIPEGFEWLARDKDGSIYLYKGSKPFKIAGVDFWETNEPSYNKEKLLLANVFPYLKWEDAEPWQIRDFSEKWGA